MAHPQAKRIALPDGLIVHDPAYESVPTQWFDPSYWSQAGRARPAGAGRGSAWFVASEHGDWVLRHYRRGGMIARVSDDRYVFTGYERTRAVREFRLLQTLRQAGLPVPAPVAARVVRHGPTYCADLLMERIDARCTLSEALAAGEVDAASMANVGAAVRRLHDHGAYHADLNAHNVLLGPDRSVHVIDFDRGRLRAPGRWRARNLRRLRRSLDKLSRERFDPALWQALEDAYRRSPAHP